MAGKKQTGPKQQARFVLVNSIFQKGFRVYLAKATKPGSSFPGLNNTPPLTRRGVCVSKLI